MAITVDDIIDTLVVQHSMNRIEAQDVALAFFDHIKDDLTNGEEVVLPSIGSLFLRKQYYHRKRRNIPVTEDTSSWQTVSFKPHPMLQARVQRASIEEARREHRDAEAQAEYEAAQNQLVE